jgi:hypothetical protein
MAFSIESEAGSLWHRWDPHIHAPGTLLSNRYKGADRWDEFFRRIEESAPVIRALGITDYFGVDAYEEFLRRRGGRLGEVAFIFPNVELRIGIATAAGFAINVHLLCNPADHDHVAKIRRFLSNLHFGSEYRCDRADLARLGRAHDRSIQDERAAVVAGANQFKVNVDELREEYNKDQWAQANILVAVAAGTKDGTSGLKTDSSFTETRRAIERFAHIIFSANPKDRDFWLGLGPLKKDELEATWNGLKPCLHGSDAHSPERVGAPDLDRYCWIKGDLTFESLRQTCFEPQERCFIGREPRRGSLPAQTISTLTVSGAQWLRKPTVTLNPGLVAVIGARGSGKTALADLVAAAAYALSRHLNPTSFVKRAAHHLGGQSSALVWESGERTELDLDAIDFGDLVDTPRVQYLSQHFVEQLCSAEGIEDELLAEIERVVFQAHPLEDRLGATTFKELLEVRAGRARLARVRQQEQLKEVSASITSERLLHDAISVRQKLVAEKAQSINKDRADRKSLMTVKGSEVRAKRLDEIATAADEVRGNVERAKRRQRSLSNLRDEVADMKTRVIPARLDALKEEFAETALTSQQWEAFKLQFVGDVDGILHAHIAAANTLVQKLAGPAVAEAAYDREAPPSDAPLISDTAELSSLTLSLLEKELDRLRRLVGVDEERAKKFSKLSEKISREEALLTKLKEDLKRAEEAEGRIQELMARRRQTYISEFQAIIDEQQELADLYAPLANAIQSKPGALGKLTFSVRRLVDIEAWATKGEELLDLRKAGPFRGTGALLEAARQALLPKWQNGSAEEVGSAMTDFRTTYEKALREHAPRSREDKEGYRAWLQNVGQWLYSTDHISVVYSIGYDGVDIESLSPGTRGIVLLLLYLAIDGEDDRPLVIDQPEENLDPRSIFDELVQRFREAKTRRQIIVVTHNANLVVNTDADQVIVAQAGPHRPGALPEITYECGGLENPRIRQHVCDILEGGEAAFKERAKRLRVKL